MTQASVSRPWYRRPIALGLVGLALMVGGYKLSTFIPLSDHQQDQAEKLAALRRLSGQGELADRLDRFALNVQQPAPYLHAGRLLFLAGLCLFVFAGVQMYHAPSSPPADESPEPDDIDLETRLPDPGTGLPRR